MSWALILLRLKSALTAAVSVFTRWPRECAIVALITLSAWLWLGWNAADARADACKAQGKASVAVLKQHKAETEARQTAITKETDNATPASRAAALAAVHRYSDAHRLPAPAKLASGEAGTGLPGPAAIAGSVAAPSTTVAVEQSALEACALNSADLDQAVAWAKRTWTQSPPAGSSAPPDR